MPLTTDDIVETNQLDARYNNAIDSHDGEAFAACFTADGHLDTGMGPGGHNVMATGRYVDELIRTEQGWRFSRRVFTPDT